MLGKSKHAWQILVCLANLSMLGKSKYAWQI